MIEIMQRLRANDIFDLVGLDGANRGGTQHVDHVAGKDFTGPDIPRCPQASTLDNGRLLFVACNELIGRAEGALKQAGLFDHSRPFVGVHRELVVGAFAAVAVGEVTLDHARP